MNALPTSTPFSRLLVGFASESGNARALAQRLGAPVVPSFIIRQPDGTHKVFIEPAIPFVEKESQAETIRYNTQAYTNVLERYIRQYPDQWIWMHRRWKT